MSNEPYSGPADNRPAPVAEAPSQGGNADRMARRRERLEQRDQRKAAGEGKGLSQSLIDQLPVRRRPTVISPSGRIEQRFSVTPLRQLPRNNDALEGQVVVSRRRPQPRRNYGEQIWFLLSVALPVVIATLYFAFIASNQYVAEFRFMVKDASQSAISATAGLLAAMGGGGSSSAYDNYLVTDYLVSRQAAEELQSRIKVTELYARKDVADFWSRFDASQPMEKFVSYWQGMVTSHFDQVTGIAVAQVKAFTPQDALLIANSLVKLAEEQVNDIANRTQRDAVGYAEREVARAEERLKANAAKLAEYRNRVGVIDPTTSVGASNSALTQGLRASLAQLETQRQTFLRQGLQPNAPAVVTNENVINSTKQQIASVENSVGVNKNGAALSSVIAEYEQLELEKQFAQAMRTSTMAALDAARASAASQHLYITPYVRPSLPESALYPRRILSIIAVTGLALIAWLIGLLVGRSALERLG